jgi:hypothetical protein
MRNYCAVTSQRTYFSFSSSCATRDAMEASRQLTSSRAAPPFFPLSTHSSLIYFKLSKFILIIFPERIAFLPRLIMIAKFHLQRDTTAKLIFIIALQRGGCCSYASVPLTVEIFPGRVHTLAALPTLFFSGRGSCVCSSLLYLKGEME